MTVYRPYVAPHGRFKYCEGCADRQPFDERFTPLCPKCADRSAFDDKRAEEL